MSLVVRKSPDFLADFEQQYGWYAEKVDLILADRYASAVDETLRFLSAHPGAGRRRGFRHSALKGIRSFQVKAPFKRHLIFYRFDPSTVYVERIMHGARNLPRRLLEPPAHAPAGARQDPGGE
jgi:plasmid stabilization system protein ParE